MNKITLSGFLFVYVFAMSFTVRAQNPPVLPGKSSTVIPASPNAMAFQRYGAIPVNYYNGVTQVSVPLLDIKFKDISFPIDLSYHGSGVKVDDEASKVGLGWVLNASGMISRSIIGGDDFLDGGGMQKYHAATDELKAGSSRNSANLQGCQVFLFGEWRNYLDFDTEPDQYYYNLPGGKSGKFILKRDKTQVVLSKEEKIDIKVLSVVDDLGSEWRIRTADGYTYEFLNNNYEYYEGSEIAGGSARQHKTAWYLTKIISPKGNTMTFTYNPINAYVRSVGKYNQVNSVSTIGYFTSAHAICNNCVAPLNVNQLAPGRQYKTLQLDKITYDEGHIQFLYGPREDVENDQKVQRIEMFRKTGGTPDLVRAIDFEYGYFEGERSTYQTSVYGITKRLKLKRIYDKSKNNEQGFDYKFDYYNEDDSKTLLPSKASYARDHWGYYNGKDQNQSLIPTYSTLQTNSIGRTMIGLMGDQRDPSNGDHARLFALKKVWYPTGGYSEFDYEPHAYDTRSSTMNDQSFFATSAEANGAETMLTYDGDTPGTYPASFAQAQSTNNVLDVTNAVTSTGGNVVMGFNLFFLFNSFQSSCTYTGHTLTFEIVAENGTVHYSADIFNLLNESVNPATCVTENDHYKGIQRDGSLGLPPGKYYFRVNIPNGENLFSIIRPVFRYAINTAAGTARELGGGIRIKKISNYHVPSAIPEVTRFIYDYQEDRNNDGIFETYSYGKRAARPEYSYFDFQLIQKCTPIMTELGTVNQCVEAKCETLKRDADGLMSLNGSGSPVSYNQVVVLHGENGANGKTEYSYYNESPTILNYSDFAWINGSTSVPRKPPSVAAFFDPRNGQLSQQIEYKSNGPGQYSPVSSVKNYYMDGRHPETAVIWGMEKRVFAHTDSYECPILNLVYPVQHTGWVYLSSSQEILYDQTDATKWTSTEKTYQYSNTHFQMTKMEEARSGKRLIHTFKYPADYSTNDAGVEINKLKDDFLHAIPVETKTTQLVSNVETVLSHDIQRFKKSAITSKVFSTSTSSLRSNKPLDLANVPSYVPASGFDLSKYKTNFIMEYNVANEVCSVQKPDDVIISYLWGYQNTYPIAEVTNSKPTDAFYTSFEGIGEGNSADNDSKTGKKSKTGGFSQILPVQSNGPETLNTISLTTGEYTLSYWQKVSGVWTFQTQNVTVSSGAYTINLTGQVDEVRFHPKAAFMKTFVFEPMIGVVESIDQNQNSTKFVYDAFNRLDLVRDNDGNLVTKYNYNYRAK